MRRFLLTCLLLMLSLPLTWMLLIKASTVHPKLFHALVTFESMNNGLHEATTEWEMRADRHVDAIILGSSTGTSIDPRAFAEHGLSAFNFSSSYQPISHSRHLLNAVIDDAQPAWVFLDIFPLLWGEKELAYSARSWAANGCFRDPKLIGAQVREALSKKHVYAAALASLLPWMRSVGWIDRQGIAHPEFNYIGSGYKVTYHPALNEMLECDPVFTEFDDELCEVIAEIQTTCAKYGTELVLVEPPSLCRCEWETPACWEGIPLIQGNDWPGRRDVANFWDLNHLSAAGSLSYSEWVVSQFLPLRDRSE